ncbi:hypothetical protein [Kitasatospora sp. NPDC096140]|uniref:hypothetical protein n=1 Tax=Kitasatospora sp. NPDC096140 TaxID=3155425 RepID=UPI0033232CFA
MTVGAGEVSHQQVAQLLEGAVHHAERHPQCAAQPRVGGAEAALGVGHDAEQQLVQAGRGGQRGQPDLAGRRAGVLQASDQGLRQALRTVLGGGRIGGPLAQRLLGEGDQGGSSSARAEESGPRCSRPRR